MKLHHDYSHIVDGCQTKLKFARELSKMLMYTLLWIEKKVPKALRNEIVPVLHPKLLKIEIGH